MEQLATEMIIHSDNTATNILIDQVGGIEVVNQTIQKLGYKQSKIQRKMMDFASIEAGFDNWVDVAEIGDLLGRLYHKKLVSAKLDQVMLTILAKQTDHANLEAKLPSTYQLYNKSGQNAQYGIRNDALLAVSEQGVYVVVVLSQNGDDGVQKAAMQAFGSAVNDLILLP